MKLPTREEIKVWLKTNGRTRKEIAEFCKVAKTTVDQWLSKKEIPLAQHSLIARMMNPEEFTEEEKTSLIRVPFDDEQLENTHLAASIVSTSFQEYCQRAIATQVMQDIQKKEASGNIAQLHKKKAHLQAAAGSPLLAEILEWEGDDDIVSVKIVGNSMFPKFNDGDVIDFKHKRASRSPYMKKGLIYLISYEGGHMVKKYDTRKARPDEKDSDYLTGHGTVGQLVSLNPEFAPVDITGPCEWDAWFDGE